MSAATLTFLFTDIEGSTRLWEQLPEAMAAALARHDALLHQVFAAHGGVVFKTVGDAFCVTFATPHAALQAALAAQLSLLNAPWEGLPIFVRMALHTGAAECRDGDYFGPPVNRVARLLAAGHGGQVLLSLAVQELVRDDLPPGASLRDFGERRLKDLVRPERIFQLLAPGLPDDFPTLRTLEAFRHNLPVQLTSFVGRAAELDQLQQRIGQHRLVTLIGPGGTGKTRLSLQVAAELLEFYADGAWLVELAPVADPALVLRAVVAAFSLREAEDRPLLQVLCDYLAGKELLLILDNCEHVIEASAALAEALLKAGPRLRLLASSREALGVPGESLFRVPSLALPDIQQLPPAEQLSQYEAVRLFIDRALAVQPAFQITNANAPAVAQICHRLDGIPLAIELAAARSQVLSAEQIAARLDDRFRLLTGGSRTALPRQQTLRALIDWSYDLLSSAERVLFHRLAAFAGGWTLEAAEAVCPGPVAECDVAECDILDLLTALVNKSLALAEPRGPAIRYRMLETIRQYARDRLLEAGDAPAVRDRHLAHYLALAERLAPALWRQDQVAALDALEVEHDNLRAALEWSLAGAGQAIEAGLRLAVALQQFWLVRGYWTEAAERFQALLAHPAAQAPGRPRLRALNGLGRVLLASGAFDLAGPYFETALALAETLGARSEQAYARLGLGQAAEAVALFQAVDDPVGLLLAYSLLGQQASGRGEWSAARAAYQANLELCHTLGHRLGAAGTLVALTFVERMEDHLDEAERLALDALAIYRAANDRSGVGGAVFALGAVAMRRRDLPAARGYLEENLAIQRELGSARLAAVGASMLAELERLVGNYDRAIELYELCLATFNAQVEPINHALTYVNLADIYQRRGQFPAARQALRQFFAAPNLPDNLRAFGLLNAACMAGQAGQPELGARWLGAMSGAPGMEFFWTPADQEQADTVSTDLRRQLSPAAYDAAYAAGRAQAQTNLPALLAEAHAYVQ